MSLLLPGSEGSARKAPQANAARIRRAEHLAATLPFAAEILKFYLHVAAFQQSALATWFRGSPSHSPANIKTREAFETLALLPEFATFLECIARIAPGNLAASARRIAELDSGSQEALLASYWQLAGRRDQQIGALAQFFPRAFLEPLAESLAAAEPVPTLAATSARCPLCDSRPLTGVLRPEGDGAKRFLLCSFCHREWEFRRILCPACGESDERKLPVYVAESLPHIRVEACDTCHFYLRAIDLTKDGHAVPLIDDLAALPLTLWAQEHDYFRAQPNLLAT